MAVVLITGCSSGFGLLTAISFARHGDEVYASLRDPSKANALADAARTADVVVETIKLDVTDPASVDGAVAEVVERAGRLDVLVNNAGIEVYGAVHLLSDEEMTRQLDTNVLGAVRTIRAVVPVMTAQGGGTIINVGSVAGFVGVPYSGIYAASKHALEALSEAMSFELAHVRIKVGIVEPGQFATELGANADVAAAMPDGSDEHRRWQQFRTATRSLVGGEPADPQVVADAIVEMATTGSPFRRPVGADAELVAGLKPTMLFEDFTATMRTTLDWHD